jgi:hypothetical protein
MPFKTKQWQNGRFKFNLGPEQAQARAHSAGSGFYYITQKPKPAQAWFLG